MLLTVCTLNLVIRFRRCFNIVGRRCSISWLASIDLFLCTACHFSNSFLEVVPPIYGCSLVVPRRCLLNVVFGMPSVLGQPIFVFCLLLMVVFRFWYVLIPWSCLLYKLFGLFVSRRCCFSSISKNLWWVVACFAWVICKSTPLWFVHFRGFVCLL